MFENENRDSETRTASSRGPGLDAIADRIDELNEVVLDLERRLDERWREPDATIEDLELAHKVIHATMNSERLTEDEELEIIRTVALSDDRSDTTGQD